MNDAVFKPSLNVESFIGENSSVDTERFLLFMKAYYEWMQSTTLSLTNKTGTFVVGETIVGATTGAIASIKEVKTNSITIAPTSRTVFVYTETVTIKIFLNLRVMNNLIGSYSNSYMMRILIFIILEKIFFVYLMVISKRRKSSEQKP